MSTIAPGHVVRLTTRSSTASRGTQSRTGLVVARRATTVTVRRHVRGEGVELTLPLAAPALLDLETVGRARVHRAKLTYLRDRRGKAARLALIPERAAGRRRRRRGAKAKAARRARRERRDGREPPPGAGSLAVLRPTDPPRVPPRPRNAGRKPRPS